MSTEQERANRVREAFDELADLPADERQPAIDRLSQTDPDVAREVATLLEFEDGGTRDSTAGPSAETDTLRDLISSVAVSYHRPQIGTGGTVGAYRLVKEIGRGGMGTVYLAVRDDDEYRAEVAIKLMHGATDPEMRSRFKAERQILASLDHPNIARLLDGGTTPDGAPYVVMEYVRGEPLDVYCTRNALSVEARLSLFQQLCSAVQYAHRNLVVHRDIKPGNILVDEDGTPKLLDFGIAKLLDASRLAHSMPATATGSHLLTPRFASPEQVRSEAISTASDVYSLGVLLHELLTGDSPYRVTSPDPFELARAICDEEPIAPSAAVRAPSDAAAITNPATGGERHQLARRLEGDIDNIVLKALRKEPRLRYGSPDELSEDIHRHLERMPVLARPPTLRYRAGRFASRHRLGLSAATLTLAALLGAIGFSIVQMRIALDASATAERVARQQALQATYAAASARIAAGEPGLAAELLSSVAPADRGWGWDHLRNQIDEKLVAVIAGDAIAAGFGPDGLTALSLNQSGEIRWRDVLSESTVGATALDVDLPIRDAAFSRDGRRIGLVHGSAGDRLSVWEIETEAPPRLLHDTETEDQLGSVVISTAGEAVVATGPAATWMWTDGSPTADRVPEGTTSTSLDIAADGSAAVFVRPDESGAFRVVYPGFPERGAPRQGRAGVGVGVSPDGTELAGGDADDVIRPREIGTGFGAKRFRAHNNPPTEIAYSPDGSVLAAAAFERIALLDSEDGTLLDVLATPAPVTELDWSEDGSFLVAVSSDGTAQIWNARSLPKESIRGQRAIHASTTDAIWAISSNGEFRSVDPEAQSVFDRLDLHASVTDFAVAPDDVWLASIERRRAVVRPTGSPSKAQHLETGAAPVMSLSFAADASRLLTVDEDGWLVLWSSREWKEVGRWQGLPMSASTSALSADASTALTASESGVYLWDLEEGTSERVAIEVGRSPTSVAFSKVGSLFAVGWSDGSKSLHDRTGRADIEWREPHRAAVTALVFSADGALLASGASDGSLQLSRTEAEGWLIDLDGHESEITSLSFSPDGTTLVSAEQAQTVRIWDAGPAGSRGRGAERLRLARAEAEPLVASAFANSFDSDAVAQSFRDDSSLDPLVRRGALQLAIEPPLPDHGFQGAPFDGYALSTSLGTSYALSSPGPVPEESEAYTIELWVQPFPGTSEPAMVIERGGSYSIQVTGAGEVVWLTASNGAWTTPWRTTGAVLPHGEWSHIALVRDGPTVSILVNGHVVQRRHVLEGGPIDRPLNPFVIGGREVFPYSPHANIDEVRVWSNARTPGQVTEWMHRPLRGDEPGLLAGWSFDEGRGSEAADITGRFPAQLVNSGWEPTRRGR